jgi:hypothetical protein
VWKWLKSNSRIYIDLDREIDRHRHIARERFDRWEGMDDSKEGHAELS